jgi:NitT/TauT family transport system substrate-binding protein
VSVGTRASFDDDSKRHDPFSARKLGGNTPFLRSVPGATAASPADRQESTVVQSGSRTGTRGRWKRWAAGVALGAALVTVASCGDDAGSSSASSSSGSPKLTIGYSAWPGWFPLAVAEKEGLFKKEGLDVTLKYFADYTGSLDALVAGSIDVNAQTLNDTIFAVASGADQKIVVVNDNSTGNDQIICDKSITSVEDMKGKVVAAEAGVVDHFLLLQGLAKHGMTEKDVDFQGVKTDAAAAGFAGGQFDCVGVFAPFTVQALGRPGSHAVFTSKDFPGAIPDHLVATAKAAKETSAMKKLVDAWYATLAWMKEHPEEATKIMADKAQLSAADYASFEAGTTIFTADQAKNAFEDRPGDPTSLPEMARRINPFLVSSGLAKKEADLSGLFESSYTDDYVAANG